MKKIFVFILGIFLVFSCGEFPEQTIYQTKGGYINVAPDSTAVSDTVFTYSHRSNTLKPGEQLWAIWYDSYYVVPGAQRNGGNYDSTGNIAQDYNDNRNYILIITKNPPYVLGESGYLWVEDVYGDKFVGFKIAHRVR